LLMSFLVYRISLLNMRLNRKIECSDQTPKARPQSSNLLYHSD
jgi:hypothetical protein